MYSIFMKCSRKNYYFCYLICKAISSPNSCYSEVNKIYLSICYIVHIMFFLHDGSCTKWQSNRHLERGHCFTNWVMDTKNVYNIKVSRYWRTHGNFSIFDRSSEKLVPLSVVPLHTHGWFGSWVQVMSLVTIETSINMQASEKNIFLLSKQNQCKFISKSYFLYLLKEQ